MKNCTKCGALKELAEFYERAAACKACTRAKATAYRKANIEKARAYDVARAKNPKRRARFKQWIESHWSEFPKVRSAQVAVGNAVRDKRLAKGPCEVCGAPKAHAHHDDYDHPLTVRWLCAAHHNEWHRKNGPGKNAEGASLQEKKTA
jgi:hypothetical protein